MWSRFESDLLNIRKVFAASELSIHKARNEIRIVDYAGKELVIKSFKVPGRVRSFIYSYLRHSKARRSYDYSLLLGDFAPAPVGYIEFYRSGLLQDSYYVSEKYSYDFTIREPLSKDDFVGREQIFSAFALFSYRLHENNICHQDYSPGNILIRQNGQGYEFKIVDVNRMSFKQLSPKQRAQNFCKLWADDKVLEIIAKCYAGQAGYDVQQFVNMALHYSRKHKAGRTRKARIKRFLGLHK